MVFSRRDLSSPAKSKFEVQVQKLVVDCQARTDHVRRGSSRAKNALARRSRVLRWQARLARVLVSRWPFPFRDLPKLSPLIPLYLLLHSDSTHQLSHIQKLGTMAPSRADRLAQLRALRKAGRTAFDDYEVEEAESIYETVDDEGYKKVVRDRLDRDDFVVDDNGEGYADDGREDWQNERQPMYDSESEEDLPKNSKAGRCSHQGGTKMTLTRLYSQEEARRRCRQTGQAHKGHQQVLQPETDSSCTETQTRKNGRR